MKSSARSPIVSIVSSAFFWGLVAASSLVVGGLLASWVPLGKRKLGIIMGFGAGVLLSATAYELVFEAVRLAKGSGFPALGFFAGAFTFFFANMLIGRMGSKNGGTADAADQSALVVPLVLGIILDGIPESVVIGLGVLQGGTVSLAMLVAVFISNLPEAAASTAGMRAGRRYFFSGWRSPWFARSHLQRAMRCSAMFRHSGWRWSRHSLGALSS